MAKQPTSIKSPKAKGACRRCETLLAEIAVLNRKVKNQQRQIARLTSSDGGQKGKQKYFDEKALALRLGVEAKTLQNWRGKGMGPRFFKMGRSVRYRLRDIVVYERSLKSGGGYF